MSQLFVFIELRISTPQTEYSCDGSIIRRVDGDVLWFLEICCIVNQLSILFSGDHIAESAELGCLVLPL